MHWLRSCFLTSVVSLMFLNPLKVKIDYGVCFPLFVICSSLSLSLLLCFVVVVVVVFFLGGGEGCSPLRPNE